MTNGTSVKRSIIKTWWVISIGVVVLAISVLSASQLSSPKPSNPSGVTTFDQCKQAGGIISETYPEQCRYNGSTFPNPSQVSGSDNPYIGLTEQDALAKARKDNIPARIVERDGESLAVDMSYVSGRQNMYVKDDKVFKVVVE